MKQIVCDKCKKVIKKRAYHLVSNLFLNGKNWSIDLCAQCTSELKNHWLKEENDEQSSFDGAID